MKKKGLKIFIIFLIIFLGSDSVYAATVSISTSQNSVTQGNTVKVTVKVNSEGGIYTISGSASCTGSGVTGGTDLHFEDLNTSSKTKSFTFNIKPTSIGQVTCSTSNVSIRELSKESEYTLNNATTTINVVEPVKLPPKEYDSNNFLKELSIDGQNIEPIFNKDTTEYKISLDQSIEKITINAKAESDKASVTGIGEIQLSPGENTLEIKVTAENGNEKIYKIIVTVEDQNPIKVKVGKEEFTVVRKNNNLIDKLEYYEEITLKIKDQDVVAYQNKVTNVTLVLLKDKNNKIGYYIYNQQKNTYREYHSLTIQGVTIQLLEAPEKLEQYQKYSLKIQDQGIDYYKIKESHKVGLIYGTNIKTGNTSYYVYDQNEETLSKYFDDEVKIYQKEIKKLKSYCMIFMGVVSFIVIIIIVISLWRGKRKKRRRK